MKITRSLVLKFCGVLCAFQVLVAEPELKGGVDPFFAPEVSEKEMEKHGEFKTTLGFSVRPYEGGTPKALQESQWPSIEAPTTFNSHFEKPKTVWIVDGGYLATFDGGEWGSALFYADRNARQWTRILAEPIDRCVQIKGDRFLLSGGLCHLSLIRGAVFLLERMPDGKWSTRKVIESEFGIPTLIGQSRTSQIAIDPEELLFVVSFEPEPFNRMILGIDGAGAIYPMGDRDSTKSAEPVPGEKPEEGKLPPMKN